MVVVVLVNSAQQMRQLRRRVMEACGLQRDGSPMCSAKQARMVGAL